MSKRSATRCGRTYQEGNTLDYLVWLEASALGRIDEGERPTLEVETGPDPIPYSEAVRRLLQ